MTAIIKIIDRIEHVLMATLAMCSLLLAVFEMFMRYYFPQHLPDWTAEVVVYLITASVMLSGGLLVSENRHVHADLFLRQLSSQAQRLLEIAFCLVGLGVCWVFFKHGLGIVEFALRLDERSDSSLQFPVFIYYSFVPAAFGLMAVHYLRRLWRYVFAFDAGTMTSAGVSLEDAD